MSEANQSQSHRNTANKLITQKGDLIQLVSPTNKTFIFRLEPGNQLQTHRGVLNHDDLIGMLWGSQVQTHKGNIYYLLQPGLGDLLLETRRNTQIMYPKDIGFILVTMGIGPGSLVVEAGSGSGALTTALAWAVGSEGHVYSYDMREEMQNLAKKNLENVGLINRVTFKIRNIEAGFDEIGVDALFLDIQNSYDFIPQSRQALISGGHFGAILPTMNQVSRMLTSLNRNNFTFIDACEIMLRYFKPVPDRLRPTDRMVAHTGYLIFARPVIENIILGDRPEQENTNIDDRFE